LSNTPADRSPASRTMEVKDVRCSAAACSLTTPINRFQQISSVTGSSVLMTSSRSHARLRGRLRPAREQRMRRAGDGARLGQEQRGDEEGMAGELEETPLAVGAPPPQ